VPRTFQRYWVTPRRCRTQQTHYRCFACARAPNSTLLNPYVRVRVYFAHHDKTYIFTCWTTAHLHCRNLAVFWPILSRRRIISFFAVSLLTPFFFRTIRTRTTFLLDTFEFINVTCAVTLPRHAHSFLPEPSPLWTVSSYAATPTDSFRAGNISRAAHSGGAFGCWFMNRWAGGTALLLPRLLMRAMPLKSFIPYRSLLTPVIRYGA